MEYEEESVHNAPAIAWNAIVSVAKKVEDTNLHVMTAPIIMPKPVVPQDPAANLPHALLKASNTLVIKWVCMLIGKLKASKPWPKPTKAQA